MNIEQIKLIDDRVKSWFWLYNSFIDYSGWDLYKKVIYAVLSCFGDGGSKTVKMSYAEISKYAGCSVRKTILVVNELVDETVVELQPGKTVNAFRVKQIEKVKGRESGYWFWCDKYLFKREDLDIYEKMVYLVMVRHADGRNKRAMVSYSIIARGAVCSRRKAIYVISSLVEKGLLEESVKSQKGNVYFIKNALSDLSDSRSAQDALVQDMHAEDAQDALVQDMHTGDAQDALGYPQPVQGVHVVSAPGAPPLLAGVHAVHGKYAPGAPIQETNTLCVEEQKQAFKLLLKHGITETVAFRYSRLGYNTIQNIIFQAREKEKQGAIKKSVQHYIVGLLKATEKDSFYVGNSDMSALREQEREELSYGDRLFAKHKIKEMARIKSL